MKPENPRQIPLVRTGTKSPDRNGAEIAEIFRRLHAIEPEPKGELEHTNAFTLLVAVALSAQATDAGVNKAKNIILLSQALIDNFGGEIPADIDALVTLPGVGRKTANVVLNMAFGKATFAVDTHVFRVSNALPIASGKTPEAVEAGLERLVPEPFRLHAHHWLILHGRYLCKARKPECWRCPLSDLCGFEPKTPVPRVPAKKPYP